MNDFPNLDRREEDFVRRIRELLTDVSVVRQLRTGETLFNEGEPPAGVYFVRSGRIDVSVSAKNGRKLCVCVASPGDVLAVSCSVSGKTHDSRGLALEDSVVQFAPRDRFLERIHGNSVAHLDVVRMLSVDIGRCYELMRALDAEARLDPDPSRGLEGPA